METSVDRRLLRLEQVVLLLIDQTVRPDFDLDDADRLGELIRQLRADVEARE